MDALAGPPVELKGMASLPRCPRLVAWVPSTFMREGPVRKARLPIAERRQLPLVQLMPLITIYTVAATENSRSTPPVRTSGVHSASGGVACRRSPSTTRRRAAVSPALVRHG